VVKLDYCHGSDCEEKGGPPDALEIAAMGPEELDNFKAALATLNQTLVNGVVKNSTDLGNVTALDLGQNTSLSTDISREVPSGGVQTS
jgi:hypothetical protein